MIKKVKINCDYCKDDKDCFAFRFQAHVCESCLNENGIMSMNATEKQLLEFGLQDSIRTGFDNDERKEMKMEVNSFDLEIAIHNHVFNSGDLHFNNVFMWGQFESDYVKVSKSGYIYEYEIKMSKEDFKKDFEKQYVKFSYNPFKKEVKNKHGMIANNESGLKGFSFVVPENLISVNDIPAYSGLYYICKEGNRFNTNCIKEPPKLDGKKIEEKKLNYLLMKVYYKHAEVKLMERLKRVHSWDDEKKSSEILGKEK